MFFFSFSTFSSSLVLLILRWCTHHSICFSFQNCPEHRISDMKWSWKKKTSVLSADVCSITADRRCFKTTLRLFQQQIDVVFLLHLSDNRYEQKFDAVWLEHTPRQGQKHSLLLLCRCVSTAAVTWRISVTNEWNPLNELSTSKTVKHVQ